MERTLERVEIEQAITDLAEQPFDRENFPYAFLEAFGPPARRTSQTSAAFFRPARRKATRRASKPMPSKSRAASPP
jgi:hypothetical protein